MDPKATLRHLLEAMQNNDPAEAVERLHDLESWFETGGFMPSPDDLSEICASFVLAPPAAIPMPAPYAEPGIPTPLARQRDGWPFQVVTKPPGTIPHR